MDLTFCYIILGLFGAIFVQNLVLQYKVDPVQKLSGNPYDCFVLPLVFNYILDTQRNFFFGTGLCIGHLSKAKLIGVVPIEGTRYHKEVNWDITDKIFEWDYGIPIRIGKNWNTRGNHMMYFDLQYELGLSKVDGIDYKKIKNYSLAACFGFSL